MMGHRRGILAAVTVMETVEGERKQGQECAQSAAGAFKHHLQLRMMKAGQMLRAG